MVTAAVASIAGLSLTGSPVSADAGYEGDNIDTAGNNGPGPSSSNSSGGPTDEKSGGDERAEQAAAAAAVPNRVGRRDNPMETSGMLPDYDYSSTPGFHRGDDGVSFVATSNDDDISISIDETSGGFSVNLNGNAFSLSSVELAGLSISGMDGADNIDLSNGGLGGYTVSGGNGDDTVIGSPGRDAINGDADNDTILAGDGDDYANGGTGDDEIDGGKGNDDLYGGDDDDDVRGGDGNDYADGGRGNDRVFGNRGRDVVAGGLGRDILDGGLGNDTNVTGPGRDTVIDTKGDADTIYGQREDTINTSAGDSVVNVELDEQMIPENIAVVGDKTFANHVESDIVTLNSIPVGQLLLDSIGESGRQVTIVESNESSRGSRVTFDGPRADAFERLDGSPGPGVDSTVNFVRAADPLRNSILPTPPVVELGHELIHADDAANGTMNRGRTSEEVTVGDRVISVPVDDVELEAIGTDFDEDNRGFDWRDWRSYIGLPTTSDPSEADPNIREVTENAIRDELGLDRRPGYVSPGQFNPETGEPLIDFSQHTGDQGFMPSGLSNASTDVSGNASTATDSFPADASDPTVEDPSSSDSSGQRSGVAASHPVCGSDAEDSDGDGWGWEDNRSCRM